MNAFSSLRRLKKKMEYDAVFTQSKKIVGADFIFFYKANGRALSRLGLVISKKKISKAHDRNRAKRLIREAFRQTHLPAIDVIVLARRDVAKVNNQTLLTQLGKAWETIAEASLY